MKRGNVLGVALAAFALLSCSEVETTNVQQQQAIGFEAYVSKPSRASAETLGHDAFSVFGQYDVTSTPVTVFNGLSVVYNTTTSAWEYNNLIPWVPNETYVFGAIAPINGSATFDYVNKKYSFGDPTIIDQSTQKDILVADPVEVTAAAVGGNNNNVAFTFNHILSKLKFSFAVDKDSPNAWPGEISIKVIGFVMSEIEKSATYTASEWVNYGTEKATFTTVPNLETSYDGDLVTAHSTREFFVLPQTLGNQKVKLTLQIMDLNDNIIQDNVEATAILTATDNMWKPGNLYHYTFNLGYDLLSDGTEQDDIYIMFDVTELKGWTVNNESVDTNN